MTTLDALLHAIVADPLAEPRWLVLAEYLEEYDDPRRAELLCLHRKLLGTCCAPEKHPERAAWHARIVAMLAEGVRPCVPARSVVLGEGVEMSFAFIPPGSFLMGSPRGEAGRGKNERRHRVALTRGFYLGVHLVTQAQWKKAMGRTPSEFKGDDRPVEHVSWHDCQEFCTRLGERETRTTHTRGNRRGRCRRRLPHGTCSRPLAPWARILWHASGHRGYTGRRRDSGATKGKT